MYLELPSEMINKLLINPINDSLITCLVTTTDKKIKVVCSEYLKEDGKEKFLMCESIVDL